MKRSTLRPRDSFTLFVAAGAAACAFVACAFVACASETKTPRFQESLADATIAPARVTRLRESDTAFVGAPVSFAVSAKNEYFIVDRASVRVMRFDSSGYYQGTFGRQGHGPEEFMQPLFVEFVDDSTILVSDVARRDFTLWNIDSSSFRTRAKFEGELGYFSATRNTITGTVFNRLSGTIAARWHLPSTQPQYLGKLPAAFAPTNRFASLFGFIPLTVFNDSVAFVTGESDYVRIADSAWNVIDSIEVPRRHRRGIPEIIDTTFEKGQTINDLRSQLSTPYALHRLSAARFAVLHVDFSVRNNVPVGSVFLTVIGKDSTSHRCIDIRLPVHDANAIARVAFRGDTLFVLDQYISGERAVTDIQRFPLSRDVC